VAGRWRIRHKLMLGLGLVVAILALLLAGTLKGLASYRATTKTIDSKLVELSEANQLREAVAGLKTAAETSPRANDEDEGTGLVVKIQLLEDKFELVMVPEAERLLACYRQKLEETVKQGRVPDNGYKERNQVEALEGYFRLLKEAMDKAKKVPRSGSNGTRSLLLTDLGVRNALAKLLDTSGDLTAEIYHDLYSRITVAKGDYTTSLAVVVSTSVLGVLLMGGLLRFFYGWVFYPVRDLQQGAGRVAQGDFEHRIELHSGDEMEDLAAAFNDMTGRLHEMYSDLERQVNERSRQLVRSERLANVGYLAAGVAHEINNPLHIIALHSEAIENRLAGLRPRADVPERTRADFEQVLQYLQKIQDEAFRCKEITQRLLEFSRGGDRRREPTDLNELVEAVLAMIQHLPSGQGKQVVLNPGPRVVARVNGLEIRSVVLNLVVNALDSMAEGGTLTVSVAQRGRSAELVFADTGCGMTPEVLENIFEPFYTTKEPGKGTGLGLSISHRIVSQHGGEIEAASPGLNQGSTFTVRLPLQPAEAVKEDSLGHVAA
jgi:signal transduction histidine kinase